MDTTPTHADGTDHHGQDEGRPTETAAESQEALSDAQHQRLPSMDQNDADAVAKLAGIVVQTRADAATEPGLRIRELLERRTADAGLTLSAEEIDQLVQQVQVGDAPAGEAPAP